MSFVDSRTPRLQMSSLNEDHSGVRISPPSRRVPHCGLKLSKSSLPSWTLCVSSSLWWMIKKLVLNSQAEKILQRVAGNWRKSARLCVPPRRAEGKQDPEVLVQKQQFIAKEDVLNYTADIMSKCDGKWHLMKLNKRTVDISSRRCRHAVKQSINYWSTC